MKRNLHLLPVFLVLITCSNLQAQSWVQLVSGTTAHLLGVSAPGDSVCYASGYSGIILKTTNAGSSWVQQPSGTNEAFYSLCFTDVNKGYAVGDNGAAVKTINGGAIWSPVNTGTGGAYSFRCVYFFNDSIGYITGGSAPLNTGIILKTTDAGNTWISSNTYSTSTHGIYSIYFTSLTEGYANDYEGNIIKTTNGGTTWSTIAIVPGALNGSMHFTNLSSPIVTGMNGSVFKSNNAGTSWTQVAAGTTNDDITGLDFMDALKGFAVGGDYINNTGTILNTTDGGNTWTNVVINPVNRLYRIDFADQNTGYAVGLNGTILKYDQLSGISDPGNKNNMSISAYPNPFTDHIIIDLSKYNTEGEISLKLHDVLGKTIVEHTTIGKEKFILERNTLTAGLYFIELFTSEKFLGSCKVIIE